MGILFAIWGSATIIIAIFVPAIVFANLDLMTPDSIIDSDKNR